MSLLNYWFNKKCIIFYNKKDFFEIYVSKYLVLIFFKSYIIYWVTNIKLNSFASQEFGLEINVHRDS